MNKKGITPIIAVVLLLMMTVAAAGAAFYWLTRMQQQAQSGVTGQQQKIIDDASTSVSLLSQNFVNETGDATYNLSIDVQNTGGKSLDVSDANLLFVLEDGDGSSVCPSSDLSATTAQFVCVSGCSTSGLGPNSVATLKIAINDSASGFTSEGLQSGYSYYYQLKFKKGATISGSFEA